MISEYNKIVDLLKKIVGCDGHFFNVGLSYIGVGEVIQIDYVFDTFDVLEEKILKLEESGYQLINSTRAKTYKFAINHTIFPHQLVLCIDGAHHHLESMLIRKYLQTNEIDLSNVNDVEGFYDKILKECKYSPKKVFELCMPDYNNSIINLSESIKKYYGIRPTYPTLKQVDDIFNKRKPKKIIYMVLDGMASHVCEKLLKDNDFLNKNKIGNLSSTFPSTTVCATNAIRSAKMPLETGFIGWHQYFEEAKKDITIFLNCEYATCLPSNPKIVSKNTKFYEFYKNLNVKSDIVFPNFVEGGAVNFLEFKKQIEEKIKKSDFIYAYWGSPDNIMHEFGATSVNTYEELQEMSIQLEEMTANLPSNTVLVITADHGHIDVNKINLFKFKKLNSMLERMPSLESRAMSFKVKKRHECEFVNLFNKCFNAYFRLYSREEFLKAGFLGDEKMPKHKNIDSFLGDYIAVAINNYYFEILENNQLFKSHHAGMTKLEMEVPLIVYGK